MRPPSRFSILLAFAALYLIWGSTYLAIRFAIGSMPPFFMAGTRFLSAGLLIYAVARSSGARSPAPLTWRDAAIVGGCLLLGGNGGVTLAEKYINSGLAAVMVATVPIYIVLLSWISRMSPRPTVSVLLGLLGGLVGVGILMAPSLGSAAAEAHGSLTGMGILLVSSFVWSVGSLYARRAKMAESIFLAAGQQMICGGAMLLLVSVCCSERFHPRLVSSLSFWSWIYLVLIGAIIGYAAYAFLLRHCDPAKISTYAYVNPVVAVILGALFAGETLSLRAIIAAALIIGSVAVVITAQQFRGKEVAPGLPTLAEAD